MKHRGQFRAHSDCPTMIRNRLALVNAAAPQGQRKGVGKASLSWRPWRRSWPAFALSGFGAAAFATMGLAEP